MPRIEAVILRGVTHMYGGHPALRRVDLELSPGAINFIQGPNGAGKSTLLSILATVQRPTMGVVEYRPFGASYQQARRHIGWVGHESHAYRDLTTRENIELTAELHGLAPEDAWQRVERRVGLESFADQRVGTLSAGQKQRVALARALVHAPSLLLLDEPLSGLDKVNRESVKALLAEEAARGTLLAVVTHDPEWAHSANGRLITVERGSLRHDEPSKADLGSTPT